MNKTAQIGFLSLMGLLGLASGIYDHYRKEKIINDLTKQVQELKLAAHRHN